MGDSKFPYPMWAVVCRSCGWVCTTWEKPGTACSYIEYCPSCGGWRVTSNRVESKQEHEAVMEAG